MADNQKNPTETSAQTTPTPASAPTQTQDKNLNISQGKPDLEAIQKRRRELIVKQNSAGGISPQEQQELDNINKQLGKTAKIKNKDLSKDPKEEKEEPKDIFQEKDILDYMYNDILLAFGNWCFKKTYKGVDWLAGKTTKNLWKLAGWTASQTWGGLKKAARNVPPLFTKKPPRDDTMTRFAADLNDKHQTSQGTKAERIIGNLEDFKDRLKRITEGNATDEDKNTPIFALYKKCEAEHPEKLKTFGEDMFTRAANATQNSLEIHRMAERLVALRNLQKAMSDPNPQPISPEMYKREVNLMTLVVARSISQSSDPVKSMGILDKNIAKSEQQMQSALMDGKYQANGKNPEKNKKLNKQLAETFTSIGLSSDGLLTPQKEQAMQKYAYNDPNSKKDLLERLVLEQVADSNIAQKRNQQENGESSLAQQQQDHQRREQKCNPLIAAFYAAHQDRFPGIVVNSNYSLEGQSPLRPELHNTQTGSQSYPRPPFKSDRGR